MKRLINKLEIYMKILLICFLFASCGIEIEHKLEGIPDDFNVETPTEFNVETDIPEELSVEHNASLSGLQDFCEDTYETPEEVQECITNLEEKFINFLNTENSDEGV